VADFIHQTRFSALSGDRIGIIGYLQDFIYPGADEKSGEGDLSRRLNENGKDEIAGLSAAFNRF
jgi:methyl-accepting chemotaxis protein